MNDRGWRAALALPILTLVAAHAYATVVPAPPPADPVPATPEPGQGDSATSGWALEIPEAMKGLGIGSWSDIFQPGAWTGSLGLSAGMQQQIIRSPDSSSQTFGTRLFSEYLTVRDDDFGIIDRRLVSGSIGIIVGFQQDQQSTDGPTTKQHETLNGYNFDLTFLGDSAYRSNIFANRSQSTNTLQYGGTNEIDIDNKGLTLRWGENSILRDREILPYFSASLQALQEHDRETTTIAGETSKRDDQIELVTLEAHNGNETSDLGFKYGLTRLKDYLVDSNSFDNQVASLSYSLDFGPNLNRRWDSWIDYYNRTGGTSFSNLNVNEELTIDHYDNLSTLYNYSYQRQTTPDGNITGQNGGATVQYQLWGNLNTTAAISGYQQSLPGGTISAEGAQLYLSYYHALPWNGQLTAGGGGSYFLNSNHIPSGVVPVIDAPYRAPPNFGAGAGFLLKDPFIVVDSIVIVDVKGGARLPTVAGVDYTVVVDGTRTTIEPLPTSAVIMPGDLLNVSYVYQVPPDLKFRLTTGSANFGVSWQWISINFNHDQSTTTPLSGTDSTLLLDTRRDTARVSLNGSWESLQGRADAGALRYEGTVLAYDGITFDEYLSYAPSPYWNLALSANQYRTNFKTPVRTTVGQAVRLDANLTWNNWTATAYASQRSFTDTQVLSEKIQEAGFKLDRRWARLNVTMAAYESKRTRGGVETQSTNVQITAVRQF